MTALKVVGEVTGITDAYKFLKSSGQCLLAVANGDMEAAKGYAVQAAMHGAFAAMSIGSIAATVVTGGAAVGAVVGVATLRMGVKEAAKCVLKTAVKEGFETAGKTLAKEVTQGLTKEVLQAGAKQAAESTVKELGQELSQVAAKGTLKDLSAEAAQVMTRDIAERNVASVTKEMVSTQVEKATHNLVEKAINPKRGLFLVDQNKKAFIKECQEMGIEKKAAKEMHSSLRKVGSEAEIKQILAREMKEPIEKHVRDGMKETFEKHLDDGIDGLKGKFNLSDDVAVGMKNGGREGFEAGVKRGVKEGIEEGLEKAFKKARMKSRSGSGGLKIAEGEIHTSKIDQNSGQASDGRLGSNAEDTRFAETGKGVDVRSGLAESTPGSDLSASKPKGPESASVTSIYGAPGSVSVGNITKNNSA